MACNRIPSARLCLITTCTNKTTWSWFQPLTLPYYYSMGPVLGRETPLVCKLISRCKPCLASSQAFINSSKCSVSLPSHWPDRMITPCYCAGCIPCQYPVRKILHWYISFLISWRVTFFFNLFSLPNSITLGSKEQSALRVFFLQTPTLFFLRRAKGKIKGGQHKTSMEDLVIKTSWVWGEVVQCTQRHRSKANVEIQIKKKKKCNSY